MSAVGERERNKSSKLILDFKKRNCKERNFHRQNGVAQKACMQHEGCYKCHIRSPVRMCAITQKETKVVQKSLACLPGKVKETVAANSLTSKKWKACSIRKKMNTDKNCRSNVKRKFGDLTRKVRPKTLQSLLKVIAKQYFKHIKNGKPARELVGMLGVKSLCQVIRPYLKNTNEFFVSDLILAEGVGQGPTTDPFFFCSWEVREAESVVQIEVNTQELLHHLGESDVKKSSQPDGIH